MKGNNIDDLFRNGLGSHKITPPSSAWDKIESQLPAKKKKGVYFWISIAASIILVFAFGWIILSGSQNQQTVDQNLQANREAAPIEDSSQSTPELKQPDAIKATIPDQQLVAKAPAKISTPSVKVPNNKATTNILVEEDMNKLQADVDAKHELIDKRQIIEIMKHDTKPLPSFFNAKDMSFDAYAIDISISLESYISSYQILTLDPTKKKRFSLLSGIVNVAKGVNNGKIALSEMRKSKNDFFNNDLKYGSKEGEPEETKGDIDEN